MAKVKQPPPELSKSLFDGSKRNFDYFHLPSHWRLLICTIINLVRANVIYL